MTVTATRAPVPVERPLTQRCLREFAAHGADPRDLIKMLQSSEHLLEVYGDRFLTRPVLLESDQLRDLEDDLTRLLHLLFSLLDRAYGGDLRAMGRAAGMAPAQIDAVLRTVTDRSVSIVRADLYQEAAGFKVLEYNIVSALGGLDNPLMNRALLQHPAVAEFVAAEGLHYVDTMARTAEVIRLESERLGTGSRPCVALVDTPENFRFAGPRYSYMAELWSAMGIDAVACGSDEFEERSGRLFLRGQAVDIIFRYFLIEDVIGNQGNTIEPLLRAVERQQVGMVTGLDDELYGNKAMLALLTDDDHRSLFTAEERALTDRLLPWSRPLRAGRCTARGQEVDLLEYADAEQENLILKPTLLHGGIGMVPGWTVDRQEWRDSLRAGLAGPYVLQERVRPVTESFPAIGPPGATRPLVLNWGVLLMQDVYAGALLRASADPNVGIVSSKNGALVGCCFHQPAAG